MTSRLLPIMALTAFALAFVAGCGGGGSSASGDMRLYASDTFRDDYSQVWVRLYKVEFRSSAANVYHTAYTNDVGLVLDAARLHDGNGAKFAFLSLGSLPVGTYDQVRLTLGDTMTIVPVGETVGQDVVLDDSLPSGGTGKRLLTYTLSPALALTISGATHIVDFDLASFVLNGNELTPSCKEGDDNGLDDPLRHEHDDYSGTVGDLTSTTFTITPEHGDSFVVNYDANTLIYDDKTGQNATLQNGKKVEVRGYFAEGATGLTATEIKIESSDDDGGGGGGGGGGSEKAEAEGSIAELDLNENSMVLTDIREVEGFTPSGSTVKVVWTETTVFRSHDDPGTEELLSQFPIADVKGTYDAGTNTLTATMIKVDDD